LTIEYPFSWTAGEATADRIHYGEGQSHELRIKGIQIQTLVEDVLGLNSQTLENRLWRPFQAVIAKADLNYGFAMPESRHMFSFFLAAPNKARERLSQAGGVPTDRCRFHDVLSNCNPYKGKRAEHATTS
jgi:hypothetical protein